MIIWTVAGIAIGQIKSLKNFTYIANAAGEYLYYRATAETPQYS